MNSAAEQRKKNFKELKLNILAGGLCTSFSICMTNYLDTWRIRWQSQSPTFREKSSLVSFGKNIIRNEGFVKGLWSPGCTAHMSAGLISAGIRHGSYPTVRDLISNGSEKNAFHMFLAGLAAGAVGFSLANPFFKAKVIIQAGMPYENSQRKTTFKTLTDIYKKESVVGLFRGSSILMVRGALLNAGNQLGYDYTKTFCKRHHLFSDGPFLHVMASVTAALLAVTFCTPADFVLTRFQSAQGKYSSVGHCVLDVYRNNKLRVFFTGWTPLFVRLGPLFLINMPMYEQFRRFLGLSYLT